MTKLRELMAGFDTAMLVTRSTDGLLRSRPMYVAAVSEGADVWFLTSVESGKVEELQREPLANVSMQGPRRFLSLSGLVQFSTDRDTLEKLWTPSQQPWFPDGVDTLDLTAIHLITKEAEYWDRSGAEGAKFAVETAQAIAEGRRPENDPPSRHGHLQL